MVKKYGKDKVFDMSGWFNFGSKHESVRHGLSAKGIKTGTKKDKGILADFFSSNPLFDGSAKTSSSGKTEYSYPPDWGVKIGSYKIFTPKDDEMKDWFAVKAYIKTESKGTLPARLYGEKNGDLFYGDVWVDDRWQKMEDVSGVRPFTSIGKTPFVDVGVTKSSSPMSSKVKSAYFKKKSISIKKGKQSNDLAGGTFIPSAHYHTKPDVSEEFDEEIWWIPKKSGKITKGYFTGSMYDAKKKTIDGEKIKDIGQ
jgi:hypothetical protein